MEDKVELEVRIDATPEQVYAALTDGEQLQQWFSTSLGLPLAMVGLRRRSLLLQSPSGS